MVAPPNQERGRETTKPPHINGQYYGWWKTQMCDFIVAKDSEFWDIICDGSHIPLEEVSERNVMRLFLRTRKKYDKDDQKNH